MNDDATKYLRCFSLIGKLYQHFRAQDPLPAKNHFGRTPLSELDFCIDVECVAKRTLTRTDYAEFLCVRLSDQFWSLPIRTRFILGAAWERAGLGTEGDYRGLFRFTSEEKRLERDENERQWLELKAQLSPEIPDTVFDVQDILEQPEPVEWLDNDQQMLSRTQS